MAVQTSVDPFPPDALPANREGRLSDEQRERYRGMVTSSHKGERGLAAVLLAVGVLVLLGNGSTSSALARPILGAGFVAVAIVLVVYSLIGGDALARDLRHTKVQTIEGALGKRKGISAGTSSGPPAPSYFDVSGKTFTVTSTAYEAAPDAGYVRLYFLPRSGKVVNLEHLPDRPVPEITTTQDLLRKVGTAVLGRDRVARAEARADIASMETSLRAQMTDATTSPIHKERDPRPLREAILGTWSSPLMKVTFAADGTVTATPPFGPQRRGHWSVDATGRLHSDITGHQQSTEAWVAADRLTISAQGTDLSFTRSSD